MKLVFLALGAIIVLGGGAAGTYFYFMKPAEASAVEKFDEHAKADSHGGILSSYEYVELDPLILPIVDSTGVSQTVSLVIALEVPGSVAKLNAERVAPKLKDAFIQDMYGVLNKHAALKGGVIQVDMLKKRLNRVSVEVLGAENINDVLLQVVQQRPI